MEALDDIVKVHCFFLEMLKVFRHVVRGVVIVLLVLIVFVVVRRRVSGQH